MCSTSHNLKYAQETNLRYHPGMRVILHYAHLHSLPVRLTCFKHCYSGSDIVEQHGTVQQRKSTYGHKKKYLSSIEPTTPESIIQSDISDQEFLEAPSSAGARPNTNVGDSTATSLLKRQPNSDYVSNFSVHFPSSFTRLWIERGRHEKHAKK